MKAISVSTAKPIVTVARAEDRGISRLNGLAAALPALFLAGCYVMPVGPDASGNQQFIYSSAPVVPGRRAPAGPVVVPTGPVPTALEVKLYPINDFANQTGVLTGQVTNLMTGRGRFSFSYQGDTLVGEATRAILVFRRAGRIVLLHIKLAVIELCFHAGAAALVDAPVEPRILRLA